MPAAHRGAIETEGLTKRYGDTLAVDSLTLSVPRGMVYGFLGPNGAGKTTTMRLLTTLTTPTAGDAWVAGASITDRRELTPHIGYLPEEPPLYDELTGREQLAFAGGLRELPGPHMQERIGTLLDRFDLADAADDRIGEYSRGMRQKLGVMQAILHDPAVVFLDEPTSGLDPRAARTMRETIERLAANDTTVFLSTHILPVVEAVADTVGVIHEGQLVAEAPPSELKTRTETGTPGTLEDAFLAITRDREQEVAEIDD